MVSVTTRDHDTVTPDVETSGVVYEGRFGGAVGQFLLESQEQAVARLLAEDLPRQPRVLEVGGGHGQLTPFLLERGCRVWVHGSAPSCARRIRPLLQAHPDRLGFVSASLWSLPFPDDAFDLVIAIRLLAHVERWEELLAEMSRVCRGRLLVDFPPRAGLNLLQPLLFPLKRRSEGTTRPYFSYSQHDLTRFLAHFGFHRFTCERLFGMPMVVHRILGRPDLSRSIEAGARKLGITRVMGGPALMLARH